MRGRLVCVKDYKDSDNIIVIKVQIHSQKQCIYTHLPKKEKCKKEENKETQIDARQFTIISPRQKVVL